MTVAVFPGSFNPPTLAHRAIVDSVLSSKRIDRVDLTLSHDALNKPRHTQASLGTRCDLLVQVFDDEPRCRIVLTSERLLADIARDYDYLVLGADKALQLHDPIYYSSLEEMRDKLARLPELIVFDRDQYQTMNSDTHWSLPESLRLASSTKVRAGSWELVPTVIRSQCQAIYGTDQQLDKSSDDQGS
ncbi:MAG: hypothetical protein ACP5O0_05935 [Acidimicrobiales bacterium]